MPLSKPCILTSSVPIAGEKFLSSLLLLAFGILLEKAILGGLLFFLFKHMKNKALEMLPFPAPPHSLAPRAGSQGMATASSDV